MGGSSITISCKVSSVPMSLYIPFYFNIACVDSSLTDLNPEVKTVRSTGRAIISLFSFPFKFEVTDTRINFESMDLRDSAKWCI